MSRGIPFDLAFLLDDDTAKGFAVILGQIEAGGKAEFNWAKNRWETKE